MATRCSRSISTVRDSLGFHRTGRRRFRCRANAAFLTFTENRYVPIPASKKTANCSYIERWDEKLNQIRYAREKSAARLLRDVNVPTRPYADRNHVAPKLGVRTESPQARERGKPREDPHALQKLTRDETVSMHFGRSAFGVRCVLASLLLLISLGLSAAVQAQPDSLEQLADDFWAWRAKHAPFTRRRRQPNRATRRNARLVTGKH